MKRNADGHLELPADWWPIVAWSNQFYKQQKEFLFSEAWSTWLITGNGCGKSLLLYWSVVAHLLGIHPKQFAKPPLKARVIVPSFDYVTDVSLEKLLSPSIIHPEGTELTSLLPKSEIKKHFRKDSRNIMLRNGSSIHFNTSDQGWEKLRGGEQDLLVIDEEPAHRVYDEALRGLRNAKGGGKVISGLTPPYMEGKAPTWTKEFILDRELADPDIHVVRACMLDNPAITANFIKRFKQGKNKEQIQVQVYGEYPSYGNTIFSYQDTMYEKETNEGHVLPYTHDMPEEEDVSFYMAFDWHPHKACAAVWLYVDHDGNVVVYDELPVNIAQDKTIAEVADIFRNIEGGEQAGRKFKRYQDPSSKQRNNAIYRNFNAWTEFRNQGIVTSAGKNRDPEVGYSIINDYLRGDGKHHPKLFIMENCKHLRYAMSNHYWKQKGDGKATPDQKHSDFPVCLKYIMQEFKTKNLGKKPRKWSLYSFGNKLLNEV